MTFCGSRGAALNRIVLRMRLLRVLSIVFVLSVCGFTRPCFAADNDLPVVSINDNRVPAGQLENGVLTLHLELRRGRWHPERDDGRRVNDRTPGAIEDGFIAEEGHALQIPGPLIRVPQGTELHISVHNLLEQTAFVGGLEQHPGNAADLAQVAPNETKQFTFNAGEPGTYAYWAAANKIPNEHPRGRMGGAFIVDPPGAVPSDRVFVIQGWNNNRRYHSDLQYVYVINGKSWPYTERLHATLEQPEHWRVINLQGEPHTMHLHGFFFRVTAVGDGTSDHVYTPAEQRMEVTESIKVGDTFDMNWTPERAGNWLFHCHILAHMTTYDPDWNFGPSGPAKPADWKLLTGGDEMNMAGLVMGITVATPPGIKLAKTESQVVGDRRHLFVRERPAAAYIPAGPGFFLEGVSQKVGAIGPPLVITQGVRTAVTVTNQLHEPTAIHWHGIEIESYYDGVPMWDGTPSHMTPVIPPGGSFVAYMTPPRAGTFIYHTHWRDAEQLTSGLYGALLVLPPGQKYEPATDKVFVIGRSGPNGMHDPIVINGSPQPGPIVLLTGRTYRIRLINISPDDMETVSLLVNDKPAQWRAIAKDGDDLPPQQATVQDAVHVELGVGETRDFEFSPKTQADYQLRFTGDLNTGDLHEVVQYIRVVQPGTLPSVFAEK